MNDTLNEKFSVYQFFPDESYERVVELVPFERAARVAYPRIPLNFPGRPHFNVAMRSDSIVYEWIHGKGITFPPGMEKFLTDAYPETQEPPKGNENLPNN